MSTDLMGKKKGNVNDIGLDAHHCICAWKDGFCNKIEPVRFF